MRLIRVLAPLTLMLAIGGFTQAQDKKAPGTLPTLQTASGVIEKAGKDSITVKPRTADGKFQKTLVLKVTGTSKVAVLSPQKRAGKVVMTQREAEAKELVPGQQVAVVFADAGKDGVVLLTAVAHPAPGK